MSKQLTNALRDVFMLGLYDILMGIWNGICLNVIIIIIIGNN